MPILNQETQLRSEQIQGIIKLLNPKLFIN